MLSKSQKIVQVWMTSFRHSFFCGLVDFFFFFLLCLEVLIFHNRLLKGLSYAWGLASDETLFRYCFCSSSLSSPAKILFENAAHSFWWQKVKQDLIILYQIIWTFSVSVIIYIKLIKIGEKTFHSNYN